MKLQEALDQITDLQAQVIDLQTQLREAQAANFGRINPVYVEMLTHLCEGPKSISELAELMLRDNRTISQWLHAVKVKHSADIITLADGKKQLVNAEQMRGQLAKSVAGNV